MPELNELYKLYREQLDVGPLLDWYLEQVSNDVDEDKIIEQLRQAGADTPAAVVDYLDYIAVSPDSDVECLS